MRLLPLDVDSAARWLLAVFGAVPALLAALLLATLAALPARAAGETACVPGRDLLADLPADRRAALEGEASEVVNGEGRLFRIERGDGAAPSFLFATMHLSDPRVTALSPEADAAFAAADRLVVETLDLQDEALVAGIVLARPDLTLLPAGTDLLDLVPEERRAELAAALEERGMPAGSVRTLQPWFVSTALAMPGCEAERQADGAEVLDLMLLRRAEREGKALAGLESAAEQLEAIASLPLALQAEALVATVDLVDRLPDIFETMTGLYLEGRIAMISPTIESLAPSGADEASAAQVYTAFEEAVVLERNRRMDERLVPILEQGGAFVAVGALHLPGEDGLVELLRRRGWQVTRAD